MPKTMLMTTRVLLAAAAGAAALLVVGAGAAAAAPDASQATANCWLQVINDWEDNNRVDNVYAPPCYTQAIQHLNAYPDIKGYSSAIDDIQQALYAVLHEEGRGGGQSPSTTTSGPGSNNNDKHITGIPGPGNGGSGPGNGDGFFHRIANRLAPGNAQSVPLPLLVLGGLALLLLLAAAATWFAKRYQARRVTPAPAPSPVPPPRRR
jgi:hypothetical protein